MSIDTIIGILGIVITTVIAVYAIRDARKQVRQSIKLQRDLSYLRLANELVWQFVDPTDRTYSPEITKALHDFGLLAQTLNPEWTPNDIKEAAEREALLDARSRVKEGTAKWKPGIDMQHVNHLLEEWSAQKNVVRAERILGIQALD